VGAALSGAFSGGVTEDATGDSKPDATLAPREPTESVATEWARRQRSA
jgi:hypothetical protein